MKTKHLMILFSLGVKTIFVAFHRVQCVLSLSLSLTHHKVKLNSSNKNKAAIDFPFGSNL